MGVWGTIEGKGKAERIEREREKCNAQMQQTILVNLVSSVKYHISILCQEKGTWQTRCDHNG